MLGRRLGLSEGILTNIETEHKRVVEKGVAMFEEWKKRNTAAATMKALREGLEKIGRRDLSEKVRGIFYFFVYFLKHGTEKIRNSHKYRK